jgi:hypothetical protein
MVSSTNKSDHHDITKILLKVALNTIKQTLSLESFPPLSNTVIHVIDNILKIRQQVSYNSSMIKSKCLSNDSILVSFSSVSATYATNTDGHWNWEVESAHSEVYPIKYYGLRIVSDWLQVGDFVNFFWSYVLPEMSWNINKHYRWSHFLFCQILLYM